jgi:hypothetical protein
MSELIGLREYARRRGVTLGAVQKAIRAGRITPIEGKIDPEVANIQWERNTGSARSSPGPAAAPIAPAGRVKPRDGEDGPRFADVRARREAAMAELAELELAEKRGELVSAQAIERALATKILSVRESLDTLADRITPLLAAEADPAKVYALLRTEIRQVLAQLSNESRGPAAVQ